jgi:hypothetical protein
MGSSGGFVPKRGLRLRRRIGLDAGFGWASDSLPAEQVVRACSRSSSSGSEKRRRCFVGTNQGKQDGRSNVTRRLLRPVVEAANVELAKPGISTIEALTLHGLRRGAAILSEATGATASETAGQLGHRNPTITTGIYMVAMKHRARLSQAERAAFAEAVSWASMGSSAQTDGPSLEIAPEASAAEAA